MKPGTLVKLARSHLWTHATGVDHINKTWFTVSSDHVGMYIKTINQLTDLVLIEEKLIQVARGVMEPVDR